MLHIDNTVPFELQQAGLSHSDRGGSIAGCSGEKAFGRVALWICRIEDVCFVYKIRTIVKQYEDILYLKVDSEVYVCMVRF